MVDALYKPLADGKDDGIIRYIELLVELSPKSLISLTVICIIKINIKIGSFSSY
jgi:hypothetical protein